jgi:homoserine dehydrogenase
MSFDQKQINIGIIGLGVVGSGAVRTLQVNGAQISAKVGAQFVIKRVAVKDTAKVRDVELPPNVITNDPIAVTDDPEIDIVCELMGGVEPARTYVERALKNGKSVVTANKEMVAKVGNELMRIAEEKRLDFLFEGSVGGGIPIVQPLKQALAANQFSEVMGIVNGTTNYILTKMTRDGSEYNDVLAEAQARGYAEPDPTNDVAGFDAQYKIAILSSIAFNTRIDLNKISVEGITRLAKRDFEMAAILEHTIKLVGIGQEGSQGVRVRVHPALLPSTHPLASVNDVYNAIYIRGNAVGDAMFYGRGAGSDPTGSAVVGDLIEIARNRRLNATGRLGCTCFYNKSMLDMDSLRTKYYVRLTALDRPKVLASVANVLGDFDVSIETVEQRTHDDEAEIVLMSHKTIEKNFKSALDVLGRLNFVKSVANWIRVED